MPADPDALVELDRRHVWHPYAASPPALAPYPVASAQGMFLELADGRRLIDGMSSWWAAIHGHAHPALIAAARRQLDTMPHVMFGGLTHRPAVELARRLADLAPGALPRVFLCDSGSVSVEVAIKLALQYWYAGGRADKRRLLTVRGGYHGDTTGAMAVCDPITGMHGMFAGLLPQHVFAPRPECRFDEPWDDRHAAELTRLIAGHAHELAAVILEPIVQGAGGMWFYSPAYLARVRALCDAHDVLLVADEIATGFGRTGKLFACEHAGISPDILCVGKALTGGVLTLAATLTTDAVAERVSRPIAPDAPRAFMHGPTFMANPLACAVASASLDLLATTPWARRVAAIQDQLARELAPCRELPGVADVRVLGAIGVVELERAVDMAIVQPALVDRGVWLRPFGKLVYTMPPFIAEPEHVARIGAAIREVIAIHAEQPTAPR